MSNYQVLWIDDEYKKLEGFSKLAQVNGITLVPYQSTEEGIRYLSDNMGTVDAVLLDAMAYQNAGQQEGTESRKALYEAWEQITALSSAHQKPLPRFILTGQPSLMRDTSFQEQYEGFFRKGSSEESKRLFAAIKEAIDHLPDVQLRYRFTHAFACTDQLLGANASSLLLKVLKEVESPTVTHDDDRSFNTLRQLVEAFLLAAHRHKLLPDQCLKGHEVNLTAASIFLSGQQMNPPHGGDSVKLSQPSLPKILADSLRVLIELTSNGSHYQQDQSITLAERETAKQQLQVLRQTVRTPYLLVTLTYKLLDLLVWLKALVSDPARLAAHQNNWTIELAATTEVYVPGTVTQLFPNRGVFVADSSADQAHIHQSTLQGQSLREGMRVEAVLKPNPQRPGAYVAVKIKVV
ncbi:hypothetical protein FY528_05345 [Hymenobacter lutimineralis]|uniref:Uncharacterized protein n=1 Tax=Hymenobacter lutimineralis TaxID=2606448 RepID=A0A5D6VB00_9BACT|nr:hypothetical protein [Hymenobacter lutimineralis]TYZ12716.1 hypothetical protein FY528_05345 [Hymenobacter lutimineralis]